MTTKKQVAEALRGTKSVKHADKRQRTERKETQGSVLEALRAKYLKKPDDEAV